MVSEYLIWWYGEGIISAWRVVVAVLYDVTDFFSLPILVRTWFSPWKNDTIVARNISLGDQWKIWQQNFISRFFGFMIRTIIILFTLFILAVLTILSAISVGVWLLVPFLPLLLPLLSIWVLSK